MCNHISLKEDREPGCEGSLDPKLNLFLDMTFWKQCRESKKIKYNYTEKPSIYSRLSALMAESLEYIPN